MVEYLIRTRSFPVTVKMDYKHNNMNFILSSGTALGTLVLKGIS